MTAQLSFTYKSQPKHIKIKPLNINFAKRRENNFVSEMILQRFCRRINNQNQRVLIYLTFGHELTFDYMYQKHKIKHLPRRIKDLQDFLGLRAERRIDDNGCAHYYFTEEQRIKAIAILKGISC